MRVLAPEGRVSPEIAAGQRRDRGHRPRIFTTGSINQINNNGVGGNIMNRIATRNGVRCAGRPARNSG